MTKLLSFFVLVLIALLNNCHGHYTNGYKNAVKSSLSKIIRCCLIKETTTVSNNYYSSHQHQRLVMLNSLFSLTSGQVMKTKISQTYFVKQSLDNKALWIFQEVRLKMALNQEQCARIVAAWQWVKSDECKPNKHIAI